MIGSYPIERESVGLRVVNYQFANRPENPFPFRCARHRESYCRRRLGPARFLRFKFKIESLKRRAEVGVSIVETRHDSFATEVDDPRSTPCELAHVGVRSNGDD